MLIVKAQVSDIHDLSLQGKFEALIKDHAGADGAEASPVPVIYTSPYFSSNQGGFFSIPAVGEMILVFYDGEQYYYITTITDLKDDKGVNSKADYRLLDNVIGRYAYNEQCLPQRIYFSDQVRNAIIFDNYYDLLNNRKIKVGTTVRSSVGKKLKLSDSPSMNAAMLVNESGDGIKISGNTATEGVFAARNIYVDSKFSHHYRTLNGQMKLEVQDGRDMFLVNTSNGGNSADPSAKTGNINLISKYRAINIFAKNQDGRGSIVLEIGTPGQPNTPLVTLAIKADGSISLKSSTFIDIEAADINVKALNNLNLEAANININAAGQLNCKGSNANFFGDGAAVVNGGVLNLNPPGASLTIPPVPEIQTYQHDYRTSSV